MKNLLNESMPDRIIRIILGAILLYLGLTGIVSGGLGIVLDVVGGVALFTGLIGWCPAYSLFKFSTKK